MDTTVQAFERYPIIAAVKDEAQLRAALASECGIVFFLFGSICNIGTLVEQAAQAGKLTFVHLDLVQGLSNRDVAADFIRQQTRAAGVISTSAPLLRHAKALGLATVLRIFLLDSLSLSKLERQVDGCGPDLVEIMPGVMPKVIRKVAGQLAMPVIAGGLIFDKEDVISALSAGALCVSTTCQALWAAG